MLFWLGTKARRRTTLGSPCTGVGESLHAPWIRVPWAVDIAYPSRRFRASPPAMWCTALMEPEPRDRKRTQNIHIVPNQITGPSSYTRFHTISLRALSAPVHIGVLAPHHFITRERGVRVEAQTNSAHVATRQNLRKQEESPPANTDIRALHKALGLQTQCAAYLCASAITCPMEAEGRSGRAVHEPACDSPDHRDSSFPWYHPGGGGGGPCPRGSRAGRV